MENADFENIASSTGRLPNADRTRVMASRCFRGRIVERLQGSMADRRNQQHARVAVRTR